MICSLPYILIGEVINFLFAWNTENNNACENDQHALYVAPHNEIHMCTSAMLCMITGPCSFEYLYYSILDVHSYHMHFPSVSYI